ncbi:unannotated protein [freshwater metagenome]|uniref:Unannotated protein n=1 Tax=freshwater metagenome TaxID=449393 RepID=A0A6J7FTB9_9ZZZZ
MVFHVLRQAFACIQAFFDFGVRNISCNHHWSAQHHASLDGILRQRVANLGHWLIEINRNDLRCQLVGGDFRKKTRWVSFEHLEKYSVCCDLAERLTISATRHGHCNRATCTVAWKPNNSNVMAKVFSTELRTDASLLCELEHLGF